MTTSIIRPSSWPCPAYAAAATTNKIEMARRSSRFSIAEHILLAYLADLAEQRVFPAVQALSPLGPGVILVPWKAGGRVWIGDARISDQHYQHVWRQDRRLLLRHLGGWSAAVVTAAPGSTIRVPSLPVAGYKMPSGTIVAVK
jgi:hypothetical protein